MSVKVNANLVADGVGVIVRVNVGVGVGVGHGYTDKQDAQSPIYVTATVSGDGSD